METKQRYYEKDLSPFFYEKENLDIKFELVRYEIKEKENIKLELYDYENWNVFDPNLYNKKQLQKMVKVEVLSLNLKNL